MLLERTRLRPAARPTLLGAERDGRIEVEPAEPHIVNAGLVVELSESSPCVPVYFPAY